ncbi:MAG: transcriptional regulator GutM [Mycoplasmatales bacterium]
MNDSNIITIFIFFIVLFILQSIGGIYQVKNYKKTISTLHQKGNIGIGQKKGSFFKSNIVIIACDNEGIIQKSQILDGMFFFSKFHNLNTLLSETMEGKSIYYFLEKLEQIPQKKQKKTYKSYLDALHALQKTLQK